MEVVVLVVVVRFINGKLRYSSRLLETRISSACRACWTMTMSLSRSRPARDLGEVGKRRRRR